MNLLHQSCNNDLPLLDYSHLWPAGPGPMSSPECCQDAASNNHLTSHLLRHPSFSVSWQQLIFYQAGILSHDPPWILYNLIFAPARKYFYSNNNNEMAQFPFTESETLSLSIQTLHIKYFFPFHPNIFQDLELRVAADAAHPRLPGFRRSVHLLPLLQQGGRGQPAVCGGRCRAQHIRWLTS